MRKKIKTLRSQHGTIEIDRNLFDFFIELKKYFKTNSMSKCEIRLVENRTKSCSSNKSRYAIKIIKENFCDIEFIAHRNGIELYKFDMYLNGIKHKSSFMNAFTHISKSLKIKIHVNSSNPSNNSAVFSDKRYRFYSKFNFRKLQGSKYWVN